MREPNADPPTLADILTEPRREQRLRHTKAKERESAHVEQRVLEAEPFRWLRTTQGNDGIVRTLLLPQGCIPGEALVRLGEVARISAEEAERYR